MGGFNILIHENVTTKWSNTNREWYESKGYTCTKITDTLIVKTNDLPKGSMVKVKVKCDYCDDVVLRTYKAYLRYSNSSPIKKDCCQKCKRIKEKESVMFTYGVDSTLKLSSVREKAKNTLMNNYGVDNPFQAEDIKEKIKQSNIEKYGVENYASTEECREKMKATSLIRHGAEYYTQTDEYKERVKITNLEKYGCENPSQNNEIKQKIIQSNIEKYGVPYSQQNKEVREKTEKTNLKRYGVKAPAQNPLVQEKIKQTFLQNYGCESALKVPEVQEKIRATFMERYGVEYAGQIPEAIEKRNRTLLKDGKVPTSQQQIAVYNMLKENSYNVELNYPVSKLLLDVALFVDNVKIDIEYDGYYFHKDTAIKDRRRDEFLKQDGWKILRIKGRRNIPTFEKLQSAINKLLTSDRTYTELVLDDWGLTG